MSLPSDDVVFTGTVSIIIASSRLPTSVDVLRIYIVHCTCMRNIVYIHVHTCMYMYIM